MIIRSKMGASTWSGGPPNKRVQRTRLRSPLTRHPLGRGSLKEGS